MYSFAEVVPVLPADGRPGPAPLLPPVAGQTWLSYNDPAYMGQRHGAPQCASVEGLRKALAGLAQATVAP